MRYTKPPITVRHYNCRTDGLRGNSPWIMRPRFLVRNCKFGTVSIASVLNGCGYQHGKQSTILRARDGSWLPPRDEGARCSAYSPVPPSPAVQPNLSCIQGGRPPEKIYRFKVATQPTSFPLLPYYLCSHESSFAFFAACGSDL